MFGSLHTKPKCCEAPGGGLRLATAGAAAGCMRAPRQNTFGGSRSHGDAAPTLRAAAIYKECEVRSEK